MDDLGSRLGMFDIAIEGNSVTMPDGIVSTNEILLAVSSRNRWVCVRVERTKCMSVLRSTNHIHIRGRKDTERK